MGDVPPAGPDEGDPRPWEAPGSARRDVMPHRGGFLRSLAVVACVLAVLSCATLVPALVALPLGAWVLAAAHHDLDRMRAGLLDPAGERATRQAESFASAAIALGVWVLWAGLVLLLPVLFRLR